MEESGRYGRSDRLVLVAAALCLHVATLVIWTRVPIWIDEAHTALIIRGTFADVAATCGRELYPPLYFWLLWPIGKVFGTSDLALRSLSVLAASALVLPTYCLGVDLAGRRAGFYAGVLAASLPIIHYYAVEARAYSLLVLLASSSLYYFFRLCESPQHRGPQVGFALSTVMLLYTHHMSVFFVAALAIAAFVRRPYDRLAQRAVVTILAGAFLLYLPWFLAATQRTQGTEWIARYWQDATKYVAILESLDVLAIGGYYPAYLRLLKHGSLVPYLGTTIVLFLAAAACWNGSPPTGRSTANPVTLLAGLMLLPLLGLFAYSWWSRPLYLVGRYDLLALPGLIMLLSLGLNGISRRVGRIPASIAAVGLTVTAAYASWGMVDAGLRNRSAGFDERSAVRLATTVRLADLVIFVSLRRITTDYYLDQLGAPPFPRLSFPCEVDEHPAIYDSPRYLAHREETEAEANALADHAAQVLARGSRVFLARWPYEDPTADILQQALSARFKITVIGDDPSLHLYELRANR